MRISNLSMAGACSLLAAICHGSDFRVDCDRGERVFRALQMARPGDTIRLQGRCVEAITIDVDRIRLEGGGSATVEGPGGGMRPPEFDGLITVDGASGVLISGLTIQRSRAEGILAVRGAAFSVQRTIVQDNAGTGIAVNNSSVDLTDVATRRNLFGLDVFGKSSALLRGRIIASGNRRDGIDVAGSSNLEIRGAAVEASENGGFGVAMGSQSSFDFYLFQTSTGSSLTLNGNQGGGMVVGASILSITSPNTRVTISGSPTGIWLPAQSTLALGPESALLIERNDVGLSLGGGSVLFALGGLTIRNSREVGILADAAQLNIFSPQSVVNGNTLDLDLRFAAQATVFGATVGTRKCEPSVLVRGSITCP